MSPTFFTKTLSECFIYMLSEPVRLFPKTPLSASKLPFEALRVVSGKKLKNNEGLLSEIFL